MNEIIQIKSANVCAKGRPAEDILSNLCGNDFCFDDVQCGCMESFLQSLKVEDSQLQREICLCKAQELEDYSIPEWTYPQPLWWKGQRLDRYSTKYKKLLRDAYQAMYEWCARFRNVLMSTVGKQLRYDSGAIDPDHAVLTDKEFCAILTRLRRRKLLEYNTCRYPRMWPNSYGVEEDYDYLL